MYRIIQECGIEIETIFKKLLKNKIIELKKPPSKMASQIKN